MKIKILLTIFVLSFSLVALAEASQPVFRIPDLGRSLRADIVRVLDPSCFLPFESNTFITPAVRQLELSKAIPGGLASCTTLFYPRSVPVDLDSGSRLNVIDSLTNRFLGDLADTQATKRSTQAKRTRTKFHHFRSST